MFAVLNVFKPQGLTSHDIIGILRKRFNLKRIGHMGTLDPMAKGVLPVCLGQATRLIEYFPSDKKYVAEITFGKTSDTYDSEGQILTETSCQTLLEQFNPDHLNTLLKPFIGTIQQRVPLYSAVHVNGKKLYHYAHKGQAVAELPVKEVTIHVLKLLDIDIQNPDHPRVSVEVACGSGTYIRSLAYDLGQVLGCGALLSKLERTEHGLFNTKQAVSLETLQNAQNPADYLQDPLPMIGMPVLALESEENYACLTHGMKIDPEEAHPKLKGNAFYFVTYQGQPVCVAQAVEKRLKPVKVFAEQVKKPLPL